MGHRLRVSGSLSIDVDELEWRFATSGGPGGQHANTSHTRVEVRFDVAGSRSLGPRQRARLLERLGPTVRVSAMEERSQARNRAIALDRLRARIADALHVDRPRHPTAPSAAARQRRIDAKRHRGDVKQQRRAPNPDDGSA